MFTCWHRFLLVNLIVLTASAATAAPRTDAGGDPLPDGALLRLGSARFRLGGAYVQGGALSPDGKLFALITRPDRISLFDTTTGKEARHLQINSGGAMSLVYAPDGKTLALSGFQGTTLYDVDSAARLANIATRNRGGQGGTVSFSADGRRVSVGHQMFGQKTPIVVWNVRDNKEIAKVEGIHDQQTQVALSADGKLLATWGQENFRGVGGQQRNNVVQLWDVDKGKELRQLTAESFLINAVAFAPDGKHLAMIEGGSTVSIWETATGKQLRRFAARSNSGTLLRYSPDGKRLMACTADGVVQVWDSRSGKRLALCRGPKCRLLSVEIQADGQTVAAGIDDQVLRIWTVPDGRLRGTGEGHTAAVAALGFNRDGKTLITVGNDGVRQWESASGKALQHAPHREDTDPRSVLIRRRFGVSNYLLSPGARYLIESNQQSGGMRVLERASGEEICTLEGSNRFMQGGVMAAFAADGVTFAALNTVFKNRTQETVLRVWDVGTGQEMRAIKPDIGPVQMGSVALSPNGKVVALAAMAFPRGGGGQTTEVHLWDVGSGKELQKFTTSGGWTNAMKFSPDGALLATAGQGQPVCLWDAAKGQEARTLERAAVQTVSQLAFSPDGRTLAAAGHMGNGENSKVVLWELSTGKLRAEFSGHEGTINALAFSPHGRMLASGGSDTTVLLWDLAGRSAAALRAAGPATEKNLAQCWTDLSGADSKSAFAAMTCLSAHPSEAIALLRRHIAPDKGKRSDPKEIERRIAELDDDDFTTREKAMRQLETSGKAILPALTNALENGPSLEKKRRLQRLVQTLSVAGPAPELIGPLRAIELLERLGTPEARKLVESLADGNAHSPVTLEAKAALRRLPSLP